MGTTNSRPKPKKILKKKVETKDESVEIEEINIIDDVSENSTEYQRRKEEEEQEEDRIIRKTKNYVNNVKEDVNEAYGNIKEKYFH